MGWREREEVEKRGDASADIPAFSSRARPSHFLFSLAMPIQYMLVARHAAGASPVVLAEHAASSSSSSAGGTSSPAAFRAAAVAGLERCPPANAK